MNRNIQINKIKKIQGPTISETSSLSSIFIEWQEKILVYKRFEEYLLKKNNFEIDTKTLEIKTKNRESCQKLKDPKFWILYVEYLIHDLLFITESQLLSIMNEAFSYMEYDSDIALLKIYYLQKIKKYSPCFLPDGSFDDTEDVYLNKLNKSTVNFIKSPKEFISLNIKPKSAKNLKISKDIIMKFENNKMNEENQSEYLDENEIKSMSQNN